jgi:Glutathione S-transferase, N-terminal domain
VVPLLREGGSTHTPLSPGIFPPETLLPDCDKTERHPAQLPTRAPVPQVWLQLEEKRIPYEIEKINMRCYGAKPRAFMEMVPSGLLPVMELNGRVIIESDAIMAALEARWSAVSH